MVILCHDPLGPARDLRGSSKGGTGKGGSQSINEKKQTKVFLGWKKHMMVELGVWRDLLLT